MRTIKFKGKSCSDGDWFYGNLYDYDKDGRTHICGLERGCLNIDPNTVGQFTGLLDKNRKEIYEGDIVNITDGDDILVGHGVVEWLDNWGLWYVDGEGHANDGLFDINCSDYLEVIGNIHDNPELIEE